MLENKASKSRGRRHSSVRLSAVGLFAGIGGFERGFESAGIHAELVCEIEAAAKVVLQREFCDIPLVEDIRALTSLPKVDVVAAGFPCQNLSLVGMNAGIFGEESGLIREVFRLIEHRSFKAPWLVLENVPFMLWHKKGHAIRYVTQRLGDLGFQWAYRVVDARAFGLPQRRRRVLLVASKTEDPRTVLFADDAGELRLEDNGTIPCGFYWTEGRGGLGWAVDGVPTLKGGSSIGIPSPPAIWRRREGTVVTPNIMDAERLQGFPAGWTDVSIDGRPIKVGHRWKMVGNAVSVPLARWLGGRLAHPGKQVESCTFAPWTGNVWPDAAWGEKRKVYAVSISEFPVLSPYIGLNDFLEYPTRPLSAKASAGFLARAKSGRLRFADGFLDSVEGHLKRQAREEKVAAA